MPCRSRVVSTAPSCPDWMAVRDGATLDIDDILGQAELLSDGKRDGRERLVDLEALHVAEPPAGARESLLHRRHRTETEHSRLDGGDTVRDELRHRLNRPGISEGMFGDDHRGSAAVQTWGIARRDGAPFTEGRSELGKGFECRVRSRRLIRTE